MSIMITTIRRDLSQAEKNEIIRNTRHITVKSDILHSISSIRADSSHTAAYKSYYAKLLYARLS